MSWTHGPYGGEGWALVGGVLVFQHGGPGSLSSAARAVLHSRVKEKKTAIGRAAEKTGAPARLIAAIGWSETRLQNHLSSSCCYGAFGMMPSTASHLLGREVTATDLHSSFALGALVCGLYLADAAERMGLDVSDPLSIPFLASCYNAGCGKLPHESTTTPTRLRYDPGVDGGYLPRVCRSWNGLAGVGLEGGLPDKVPIGLAVWVLVTLFLLASKSRDRK